MDNTNNAESLLFEILSGKNKLIHPGGYDCKSLDKLKNFGDLLHDIEHSIQKYRGKYNQLLQERNELSDYNYLQKLDDIKWRFKMSIFILGKFTDDCIDDLFYDYIMMGK